MKLYLQSRGYGWIWAVVEQGEEIRKPEIRSAVVVVADGGGAAGAAVFAHG
jgi:hypothetical protein